MSFFIKIKNRFLTAVYIAAMYCAFRIKVYYEDPDQKKNPPQGIYICNHMAHYDGLVMRSIFRKIDMHTLITSVWYDKKWARTLLFYENCIPVDRSNPGTKWIHDCRKVLREGGSVNIFPEGHISRTDENTNEFYPGFLLLASLAKDVPIIPVATIGKYSWFFGERKRVLVGKPIYFDKSKFGIDPAKSEAYAEEFRVLINEMKDRLRELKNENRSHS